MKTLLALIPLYFAFFEIAVAQVGSANEADQVIDGSIVNCLCFDSFKGMPKPNTTSVVEYFTYAAQLMGDNCNLPLVPHYKVKQAATGNYLTDPDSFPLVVEILAEEYSAVQIEVIPSEFMVREVTSPQSLNELMAECLVRLPDDWRTKPAEWSNAFESAVFFVPKANCSDWQAVLPTPRGYPAFRWGNHSTVEWQKNLMRLQTSISPEEFVRFPDVDILGFRADADWHGILTSIPALPENEVLRWVYFRDLTKKGTVQVWLAYSILDANGAYSGTIPPGRNYDRDTFLRSLSVPWAPTLEISIKSAEERDIRHVEHNLLRIPTPRSLFQGDGSETCENWSITSSYYGDHKVPAWRLAARSGSKPFREEFVVVHASDPDESIKTFKLYVFSSIEPDDLLKVFSDWFGVPKPALDAVQVLKLHKLHEAATR